MTVTEFLQTSVPFLSGLNDEQARALATAAQQASYNAGQTVVLKGVSVEGLHVVASGKVGVFVRANKTAPPTRVAELGPGEVFGETSILEMSMAGATIKAAADDTLIFVIPQDAFRSILAQTPEFRARAESLIAARKAAPAKPA